MIREVLPTSLIILKNSIIEGRVPTSDNLEVGELALGLFNGQESIWAKNSSGDIVNLRSPRHNLMWGDLFLSYDTRDEFLKDLNENKILSSAIVFIKDVSLIWTGGIFYGNEKELTLEDVIAYLSSRLIVLSENVYNLNTESSYEDLEIAFGGKDGFIDIVNKTILGNAIAVLKHPEGGSIPISIVSNKNNNEYNITVEYVSFGLHIITEVYLNNDVFTIKKQSLDLKKITKIEDNLSKVDNRLKTLEESASKLLGGFSWVEENI